MQPDVDKIIYANLNFLLFSVFTSDVDNVIFITNNIIWPINNSGRTYV
jgi:hypothetical protein